MRNAQANRGWAAAMVAAILTTSAVVASLAQNSVVFTTLHSFDVTDGDNPRYGGLAQATDGNLYGTTTGGGANGQGTVFKITTTGALSTLYDFCAQTNCTDGAVPDQGLVQTTNGYLYGTASTGGTHNLGTVFKINESGSLTTVYSFCSKTGCTDGETPYPGLTLKGANFFGTTNLGGSSGHGTVFRLTPTGSLTTLHSFCCSPSPAPLAAGTNGDLYGTTYTGGSGTCKNIGSFGCGTVYRMTATGTMTTLHSFNMTDGAYPEGGVIQATDGNFYGTTNQGGANNNGTVFRISSNGTLTTLYSFCQSTCTDGANPFGSLVQATDGNFYGTAFSGGTSGNCGGGCGTVFSVSVGLAPFVETVPTSCKVGNNVIILGTNLTGASSVTFNGVAAIFTVSKSGTSISTRLPSGATTGPVQVVTPSGALVSNVPFQVLP